MRNFLETDERFKMGQGDENFLQKEGEIQGIKLPGPLLNKIYRDNFLRIAGKRPHSLDVTLAKEECHRIGGILKRKFDFSDEANFAYQAEEFLFRLPGRGVFILEMSIFDDRLRQGPGERLDTSSSMAIL